MDPQKLMEEGRKLLIDELNLSHLTPEEQEEILEGLGELLMQRVMLRLIDELPESEQENFAKLFGSQDGKAMEELLTKHVPNAAELIKTEIRAGIDDHKRLVAHAVEGGATS